MTEDPCLSAVSWSDPRVDLFGVAEDSSIWHKFYTGHDWQPADKFEYLPSQAKGCPSVTSWGEGRLDIVYVNASGGNVMHKYFGGGEWGPSWKGAESLGGHHHHIEAVSSKSWGENRLDIVGRTKKGAYVHKAWTGEDWFPSGDKWEDFGGEFFSDPAIVSWGEGRLDIVGHAANGSLLHKYYGSGDHGGGWSAWEDLGGPGFIGNPLATSWGAGRMDFWGIDSSDGALHHLFWDGQGYRPAPGQWENLGGEFTDAPRVVHWKPGHADAVGKSLDDGKLRVKNYDGGRWNPSVAAWWTLAGPFVSEPALVARNNTGASLASGFYVPLASRYPMLTVPQPSCTSLASMRKMTCACRSGPVRVGSRRRTKPGRSGSTLDPEMTRYSRVMRTSRSSRLASSK